MPKRNPVLLVILDGWGYREEEQANAIRLATPHYWESLLRDYPSTLLEPGGTRVGLPEGQFGNSEVGHLNLGAGRIVYQDISRIDNAIASGEFFENEALVDAVEAAAKSGKTLHLMGLCSDGGVHSSDRHFFALLELAKRKGLSGDRVAFHVITDGRDTSPTGGKGFIEALESKMEALETGFIASVSGRYYAMDRDSNWERIERYWNCVTLGEGEVAPDAMTAIKASYASEVTDEFVLPTLIARHGGTPLGRIQDGDSVIFFNFRADRARQICRALTEGEDFDGACFERKAQPKVKLTTMTQYETGLRAEVAFAPEVVKETLGETLSKLGIAQFRCAETEKYAHVTYFFNGGREEPFEGEERKLVPSPKVATYDLQPEMSLPKVADEVITALQSGTYGFVLTNFANGDMVGHTGVMEAAIKAVGAVDLHLKRVVEAAHQAGYEILVTADHGNCDEMVSNAGDTLTNHSHSPVPLIYISAAGSEGSLQDGGALENVAPTVLKLMGEDQPESMTGTSLL